MEQQLHQIGSFGQTAVARARSISDSALQHAKIEAIDFNFFYGAFQALQAISMRIPQHQVTALIGPSGCGKTTLLRAMNRMHDRTPGARGAGLSRTTRCCSGCWIRRAWHWRM